MKTARSRSGGRTVAAAGIAATIVALNVYLLLAFADA
jgi:hypothetical protein